MPLSGDRVPAQDPSTLTGEAKARYDYFYHTGERGFRPNGDVFLWADPDTNALIGPYPAIQLVPEVYSPFFQSIGAAARIPGVSPEAREVAILIAGVHHQAAYELYAHTAFAVETTDLTRDQVDAIVKQRKKPDGLGEQASLAYDISDTLMGTPGPLPRHLWDAGVETFGGKEGLIALLTTLGAYSQLSILLNAMDAPVPDH